MSKLSDTALRVLMIIVRKTYGWIEDPKTKMRKGEDWISYSQLMEFSGRVRQSVSVALRELEEMELIDIRSESGQQLTTTEQRRGKKLFYRFNTSLKSGQVDSTSPKIGLELVQKVDTQKKLITKDLLSNKLDNKQRNAEVDRLLVDFKFTTGIAKPTDVRPRQWAYLFITHKGLQHFIPCTKFLMRLWPNVTISKIETIYRNYPLYEKEVMGTKKNQPGFQVDWDNMELVPD